MTPETVAVIHASVSATTAVLIVVAALLTWHRLLGERGTLLLWGALVIQTTVNHLMGLMFPVPHWDWLRAAVPILTAIQVGLLLGVLAMLVRAGVCPGGVCDADS